MKKIKVFLNNVGLCFLIKSGIESRQPHVSNNKLSEVLTGQSDITIVFGGNLILFLSLCTWNIYAK